MKTHLPGVVAGLLAAATAAAQPPKPATQTAKPPLASGDSRWPDVYCDLTELSRTASSELTVRYRYRNTAKRAFALQHADLVPRTRVFDPIGRTLFGVLEDSAGEAISSTNMDGITARPIPAAGSQNHWARLEAPPEGVTSLSVLIEGCLPFDDVAIGGSGSEPPRTSPAPAIASQEAEAEGLMAEITSISRSAGGVVTITMRYQNNGSKPHVFPHAPLIRGIYFLDPANRRKYEVARDRADQPLCSETLNYNFPSGVQLRPGESISLWAKFGAPPESTRTVNVHLPMAPPFDNVPLAGAGAGLEDAGKAVAGAVVGLESALEDLGAKVSEAEIRIDLSADVLFDFDKADIKKEAEPSLQKVATVVSANPGAQVAIEGHTDGRGADAYNQTLSEQRAASVKQWLVTNAKLNAANITTRGWGRTKPIAHNTKPEGSDDPEGRAKNRRVEIVVRKGG
ncbi:MAG TPA: OmpA family protein [Vicinamibacterales bacterium]|nr:OmpA family protein [Vicinamibacterales bacterium]